jgi:hypothetical protein
VYLINIKRADTGLRINAAGYVGFSFGINMNSIVSRQKNNSAGIAAGGVMVTGMRLVTMSGLFCFIY